MEAIYAHYPGLIVMTPATVEDAYSMLLEAVAIDDPVIFCEHKYLYYHLKAPCLPDTAMPVGKARIARPGRDLTLVAYSAMVHEALAAADELASERTEIEVVDLRSVKPWTPTRSSPRWRAPGGSFASARLGRGAVSPRKSSRASRLKASIFLTRLRAGLNAKDTPIPYHPNLWSAHRPTARSIAAAARDLLRK